MARFSFPVPSRRQRSAAAPVEGGVSAPTPTQGKLRKVPSLSSQPGSREPFYAAPNASRNWETQSNSCISITVSDTTASHDDNDTNASVFGRSGLSSLTEGHVVNSTTTLRQPTFDEESGVLPRNLLALHSDPSNGAGGGADGSSLLQLHASDRRSITDASSLRRKQSSSTIVSYYDKSKVPLAISQQTSSSAMAKGLPSKAQLLLDIDGTLANSAAKKKKRKPVGLDLSRVFSNRKANNSTASLSAEPNSVAAPGPGTPKRSPSFLSTTRLDHFTRPRSSQRPDRDSRPTTRGSLRGKRSKANSTERNQPSQVHPIALHDSGPVLEHLYDHYEQMTFRDIVAKPDPLLESEAEAKAEVEVEAPLELTPETSRPSPPSAPFFSVSSTDAHADAAIGEAGGINNMFDDPNASGARYARPAQQIRQDHDDSSAQSYFKNTSASYSTRSEFVDSRLAKLTVERSALPALQLPFDADCADSISSRHTRTSKASRRTSQSLVDSDLKQISILSLSSDSEDDDVVDARPQTSHGSTPSPPALSSLNDTDTDTNADTALGGGPSPYQPWPVAWSSPVKGASSHISGNSPKRFPPILDQAYPPVHSNEYAPAPVSPPRAGQRTSSVSLSPASTSKPSTSRMSYASTRTTDSLNAAGYTVHEARAITMVPAQGASYHSAEYNLGGGGDAVSPSELETTPPLSPSSMDFLVNATTRLSASLGGSSGQAKWQGQNQGQGQVPLQGSGRLMAVTRQEELLLAALRKKRLRMRESIIAEFEEGLEREPGSELPELPPPSRRASLARQSNRNSSSSSSGRTRSSSADAVTAAWQGSIDATTMATIRRHQQQLQQLQQAEPLASSGQVDAVMHFEDSAFPRPPSSASTASFGYPAGFLSSSSPSLQRPLSSRGKWSSFGPVHSSTFPYAAAERFGSTPSPRLSNGLDFDNRYGGGYEDEGGSGQRANSLVGPRVPADLSPLDDVLASSSTRRRRQPQSRTTGSRHRRSGVALQQQGLAANAAVDGSPAIAIVDEALTDSEMPLDQYDGLIGKPPVDDSNNGGPGIPRPDSPVEMAVLTLPQKRAARISAVGPAIMMGGGW